MHPESISFEAFLAMVGIVTAYFLVSFVWATRQRRAERQLRDPRRTRFVNL